MIASFTTVDALCGLVARSTQAIVFLPLPSSAERDRCDRDLAW
jgi:hypothetical protein